MSSPTSVPRRCRTDTVGIWLCNMRARSAICVICSTAGGHLAYLCSSAPDTVGIVVGISRFVLGISGCGELR